jgi:hypothetical protein
VPKRQHMTKAGWLSEDGVIDLEAAYMAARSHRTPNLTYREGMLAVFLLMRSGKRNCEIERIIGQSKSRVSMMVIKIRENPDEYESLLRKESARFS